eukprot:3753069-Alexandrium_andersonii.AAC.1
MSLLQERVRSDPVDNDLPRVLGTVDTSAAFLQGLCTAVAVLAIPCAAVAVNTASMRRSDTPGLAWVMASAQR